MDAEVGANRQARGGIIHSCHNCRFAEREEDGRRLMVGGNCLHLMSKTETGFLSMGAARGDAAACGPVGLWFWPLFMFPEALAAWLGE